MNVYNGIEIQETTIRRDSVQKQKRKRKRKSIEKKEDGKLVVCSDLNICI